jgi:hypothetical protein
MKLLYAFKERAPIFIELVVMGPCWRRILGRWIARAFVYAAAATARREGHVETLGQSSSEPDFLTKARMGQAAEVD